MKKSYSKKLFELLNTAEFEEFYEGVFGNFISGQLEIDESISYEEARGIVFREFEDLLKYYVEC